MSVSLSLSLSLSIPCKACCERGRPLFFSPRELVEEAKGKTCWESRESQSRVQQHHWSPKLFWMITWKNFWSVLWNWGSEYTYNLIWKKSHICTNMLLGETISVGKNDLNFLQMLHIWPFFGSKVDWPDLQLPTTFTIISYHIQKVLFSSKSRRLVGVTTRCFCASVQAKNALLKLFLQTFVCFCTVCNGMKMCHCAVLQPSDVSCFHIGLNLGLLERSVECSYQGSYPGQSLDLTTSLLLMNNLKIASFVKDLVNAACPSPFPPFGSFKMRCFIGCFF